MLITFISTLIIFCFHSFFLGSCGVMMLDDKRQGQIPLPRIGRGNGLLSPLMFYHILVPIASPTTTTTSEDLNLIDGPSTSRDELNAWLLSHLDRRKRSLISAGTKYNVGLPKSGWPYTSSNYNPQHVMAIEDLIRHSPWAIWALKDKKMAFSPRLGRAMTPRLGKKSSGGLDDEGGTMVGSMEKKALAFSPRLGRAMLMTTMDQSDDDALNVETRAAFSPRLGRGWGRWSTGRAVNTRASTFAPRLGRSYNDFNSSDTNAIHQFKI